MNLIEGLMKELNRNRELKIEYDLIPTGFFGSSMIQVDIINGEKSIASGDVVEMMRCYEALKGNE